MTSATVARRSSRCSCRELVQPMRTMGTSCRTCTTAVRNASEVAILSAQDFAGPPLAVIELPVRVPFGFHGAWVPDQS